MKKSKIITICIICAVAVAVGLTLVFVLGKKPKQPVQLAEPNSPVCIYDGGKIFLATEQVENATSYKFIITNSNWSDDVEILSTENRCEVTNIFEDLQTYRFCVIAIGTGNFLDSDQSDTNSYTTLLSLESPTVVFANDQSVITWQIVENAQNYSVYMSNGDDAYSWIGDTETASFGISSIVERYQQDNSTIFKTLNFYVTASAPNSSFATSRPSNILYRPLTYKFDIPQNLKVISNADWKFEDGILLKTSDSESGVAISWSAVLHCSTYVLKLNDQEYEIDQNSLSIDQNIATYVLPASMLQNTDGTPKFGDYSVQIKCASFENILQSSYCEQVSFSYKQKIEIANNLNIVCYVGDNFVLLKWDSVSNAISYLLKVGDGIFANSISNSTVQLSFAQFCNLAGYNATDKSDFMNHFVQEEKLNISVCIQVESYANYIASDWSSGNAPVAVKDYSQLSQ